MRSDQITDAILLRPEETGERDYPAFAITQPEGLHAIAKDWQSLEQQTGSVAFFQSWSWTLNFLNYAKADCSFQPFVLAAKEHGTLVALLPLAIQAKTGRTILTGLTEPFQQYTEMLIAPGHDPEAVFRHWLPLIRNSGADVIHLGQIRHDSHLHQAVKPILPPSGERDAAPFVDLSCWPDFAGYYQTVKSKTRKNIRNAHNRLESTAPVRHEVFSQGPKLADVIDRTFAWRKAWLTRSGLTSRAFSDEDFSRFVDRLASGESAGCSGLAVIAMRLSHGDRPIAEQWGFVHESRYYAFMSGWDPAYEAISPGKLHLGQVLQACYEYNLKAADFMIPAVPYKSTWAKQSVPVQDHVLALTPRGHLYVRLWLDWIRPTAKTVLYRLPIPVRNLIFRFIR